MAEMNQIVGLQSDTYSYLYDRMIDVTLYSRDGDKDLKLECKRYGVKPDIAFTITEIPGSKCFNASVQIRNFFLPDISDYVTMVIKAGYYGTHNNGDTIEFQMSIFSAYNESPNPDGITTFNGIVVGDITGFMTDKIVKLNIYKEKTPLSELIEKVVDLATQKKMTVCNYLPDECDGKELYYELVDTKKGDHFWFQSGYAALMWLQSQLFNICKKILGIPVFLSIWQNYVSIIPLYYDKQKHDDIFAKYKIANLDAVTRASFTGPALSVVAPWKPSVIPGSLIYMEPRFYQGQTLTQDMVRQEAHKDHRNLYYVLRNEIKFGIYGNVNQMNLYAIPVQYVIPDKDILTYKAPQANSDEQERLRNLYIKKHDPQAVVINIGEGSNSSQPTHYINDFWSYATDKFQDIPGENYNLGSRGNINNWSEVAHFFWRSKLRPENPDIWKIDVETLKNKYSKSTYEKICNDSRVPDIIVSTKVVRVPLYYFWPLIPLATYWCYRSAGNKGPYGVRTVEGDEDHPAKEVLRMDLVNPDIVNGHIQIRVPLITSSDAQSGNLDYFANALIAFGNYYIETYPKGTHRYDFGINTFLAGVCVGGYDG